VKGRFRRALWCALIGAAIGIGIRSAVELRALYQLGILDAWSDPRILRSALLGGPTLTFLCALVLGLIGFLLPRRST
jgi:hypothetical protein